MTDALLEVDRLGYRYDGGGPAIEEISFAVARGEFVSIVGPSGSGKTTLLRCIAGLMGPSSGEIRLSGQPVTDVPKQMALVFQDYGRSLFPWMTVRDNVDMPLRRLRLPVEERRERIESSLAEVGLADAMAKYPWQLSGGMQQRVAIARAIAYRPEILLMDEPFASVDAQTRADLQDMALEVWKAHRSTVLFVTHDIDEAIFLSNRVAVMSARPGRIKSELRVELPHPRHYTMKTSPEFSRYKAQLTEDIRIEAMKAAEMQI
jgi:NitT/TauT family transport system ATP-binding protein